MQMYLKSNNCRVFIKEDAEVYAINLFSFLESMTVT